MNVALWRTTRGPRGATSTRRTKSGARPTGSALIPKRSSAGGCLSAGVSPTGTTGTGGWALGSRSHERTHCGPIADPLHEGHSFLQLIVTRIFTASGSGQRTHRTHRCHSYAYTHARNVYILRACAHDSTAAMGPMGP